MLAVIKKKGYKICMRFLTTIISLAWLCCMTIETPGLASEADFYKEINLVGGYSNEDGWVGKKTMVQKNSVGFEYFQKFANDYGDFLTVDLQMRLAYDPHEAFDTAWGIEIHNAWAEYKLGLGHNIRAGHFSPAFGLEPIVDTHGTLFQTLARENIGFKKDWGMEYRGVLGDYDIALAGQLGSGMSIERKDSSFLATGRIGTPPGREFSYGLSVLYGEVLQGKGMSTFPRAEFADNAVNKKRIGIDGQYETGSYLFEGELVFGQDEDDEVLGFLLGIDYTVPTLQSMVLQVQTKFWDNDISDWDAIDSTISVGLSYKVNSSVTLRTAYFHDIATSFGECDRQVILQFYYYA
jgi:hypothetical protein